MEKFFKLQEHGTNVKTEVFAGITTFLTMAYILAVNVSILSIAGLPSTAVFFATSISAAVACIFMGLYANAPIALASGMGLNAFFTFTVVLTLNYTYQEALAMVFVSGVIFLIISLLGLRKKIVDSIPASLKKSIGAAIGFFIAFIGLVKMGVIVDNPATLVGLGNIKHPTVLLGLLGLFITIVLLSLDFKAGVFIGILLTAVIGVVLGMLGVSNMPQLPTRIVDANIDTSLVGAFIQGLKSIVTKPESIVVIFTMLFVDFFDTAGTLIAVTDKIEQHSGKDYNMDKMFYSDAIGTITGSVLGTSNVTSYIESGSGVAAGGRTGLTAVVTGVLFLLATFFAPLLQIVSSIMVADGVFLDPIVAPALVVVGILMATQLSSVDWHDFTAASSGFVTIIVMILTYSIANGIAAGFIVYVITKVVKKEIKEIKPAIWILFVIFILHFSAF
ncbi:NCS2 family permease [Oceanivirga miroungae]|uniref:Xanthine/uracil/vitamin C permease n=1 Tax=Oceanivirga miroungae TaxID=1130046 RepID=A0A6I8M7K8_9FUSO|nr:NCS2 family permease [Oceanivirga miroungae]VWL85878.1 xanthine/uracil/vitamin C permease [Oceanivirga miroungae]